MTRQFLIAQALLPARRAGRWPLPLLLLSAACSGPSLGPTTCDGLAGKTLAITRADYTRCAGEILESLEALESSLQRYVNGDETARQPARSASRRLGHLMREAGLQGDAWRQVQGGAGRTVERWPDSAMREFNAHTIQASAQLNAALTFPNQDNLQQGARGHAGARSAYSRFR